MGHKADRWIADDGKEFTNRKDMVLYEMSLVDIREIDAFLEMKEVSSRRVTEYKKLLVEWQAYMRSSYPVVEKTEPIFTPEPFFEPEPAYPKDYAFKDELVGDDPFEGATAI